MMEIKGDVVEIASRKM